MAIFNSYVKLPEGIFPYIPCPCLGRVHLGSRLVGAADALGVSSQSHLQRRLNGLPIPIRMQLETIYIHICVVYDHYMIILWSCNDHYMIVLWSLYDHYMTIIWSLYDHYMISTALDLKTGHRQIPLAYHSSPPFSGDIPSIISRYLRGWLVSYPPLFMCAPYPLFIA